MIRNKSKKEKGITLVALIITIIVLIILAAVTIIQVVKLDIINIAAKGTGNYAEKQEGEKIEFDEMSNFMSNVVEQIGTGKGQGGDKDLPKGPNGKPLVGSIGKDINNNQEAEDRNGNPITIPAGFIVVPNSPEGTELSKKVTYSYNGDGTPAVQDGIVIEDEEGNQFVWMPVGEVKNKDGDTRGKTTTITLGRYEFDTSGTETLRQEARTEGDYYKTVVEIDYGQELVESTTNTPAKDLKGFIDKTKVRRRILYSEI